MVAKQYETWTDEIAVEVFVADANPPHSMTSC
jgi:hypothetical protein